MSKFMVSMEASGLPFTLVLNKVDLVSEEERQARLQQVRCILLRGGTGVLL